MLVGGLDLGVVADLPWADDPVPVLATGLTGKKKKNKETQTHLVQNC